MRGRPPSACAISKMYTVTFLKSLMSFDKRGAASRRVQALQAAQRLCQLRRANSVR